MLSMNTPVKATRENRRDGINMPCAALPVMGMSGFVVINGLDIWCDFRPGEPIPLDNADLPLWS